ncbi:hypothetical protein [Larsenimonas rhizosphaerae]|uniref:Uncharacterized protein n=1 Tax=Larsenimonas rhizosphaerae TaxID=2944682 RepID=A0AA42CTD4_9GAMM|nr:hypothetical protein [Larsenimonas rhizosphaerae]MCX2522936.1 hypothetical protein [Larsenimonas rhizosphaerae]
MKSRWSQSRQAGNDESVMPVEPPRRHWEMAWWFRREGHVSEKPG